jgi:hypothetical protein
MENRLLIARHAIRHCRHLHKICLPVALQKTQKRKQRTNRLLPTDLPQSTVANRTVALCLFRSLQDGGEDGNTTNGPFPPKFNHRYFEMNTHAETMARQMTKIGNSIVAAGICRPGGAQLAPEFRPQCFGLPVLCSSSETAIQSILLTATVRRSLRFRQPRLGSPRLSYASCWFALSKVARS